MDMKKRNAGYEAVKWVEDGMTIGLGSGSTANYMLERLGERVRDGLTIRGIPTSKKTEIRANELGIPLIDLTDKVHIDLAIDGADEIDHHHHLLKGGGGSLVREKIVAELAGKFIVVADESKYVSTLGEFTLPVEILPFAWQQTVKRISHLGGKAILRLKDEETFVSDNGNYIVDCDFGRISKPIELHQQLKLLVGVVETGLFIHMADKIILGDANGVQYKK